MESSSAASGSPDASPHMISGSIRHPKVVVAAGTPSEESSPELGSPHKRRPIFLSSIHLVTIFSTLPSAGLGALLALGSFGSQRGSPSVRQKSNPARCQ